jgi:hypothetical protein
MFTVGHMNRNQRLLSDLSKIFQMCVFPVFSILQCCQLADCWASKVKKRAE